MKKTAIVIPTYNERENVKKLIPVLRKLGIPGLILVFVDDNSPDKTGEIIRLFQKDDPDLHLISRPRKLGLGTAYLEGFRYALELDADFIFEMDADFSHDPQMIPKFLEEIENCDLVIGSRYLNGISIVNWPLRRLVLSLLANKYVRIVTGMKLTDATSGFKGYRRRVLEVIGLDRVRSNGYAFQIEMKYRAHKKNFSIREIPIIFVDRHSGTSKISRRIIWEAIWLPWKLRLRLVK